MADSNVDIRLRLLEARLFQAEAKASEAALRGVGTGAQTAGTRARGASGHMGGLRGGIASLSRAAKVGALALGGLGLAAGAFGLRYAKSAITATVELAKGTAVLHKQTGMDVRSSAQWVAMAKGRGLQLRQLQMGFKTLETSMSKGAQGAKTQAAAFKLLGVSQADLKKGDVQGTLFKVSDALAKMKSPADKARYATQLFGRSGTALLPVLVGGSKRLREQLDIYKNMGVQMDKGGLKKTLEFIVAQRKFKAATESLKISLGVALMPTLTKLTVVATKVANVFAGPGSLEEKFKRAGKIVRPLATQMGKTWDQVAPILISHIASSAPAMAGHFVTAFTHASVWGQIAIGAFLLSKLGLLGPLVRASGRTLGTSFGTQFGTRAGATSEAGIGAALTSGSFAGKLKGWGAGIGAILGPAIGAAASALVIQQLGDDLLNALSPGATAANKRQRQSLRGTAAQGANTTNPSIIDRLQAIFGASGGMVRGFQSGGPAGTDIVPAMLTPGEFVVRQPAVQRMGLPALHAINEGGGLLVQVDSYIDGKQVASAVGKAVAAKAARR